MIEKKPVTPCPSSFGKNEQKKIFHEISGSDDQQEVHCDRGYDKA